MIRSLVALLCIGLVTSAANGQQTVVSRTPAGVAQNDGGIPERPELLRLIGLYEVAERSVEATRAGIESLVKVYSNLAVLYEDASMYPKAEDTLRREIAVLQNGSQSELAEAVSDLAVLHVAMGDLRAAEKEQLEALHIREGVGEPIGIALSWNNLADVYVKKRDFKKAVDYAQKAMAVLGDDAKVGVFDRLAVRQTLAFALCGVKECGKGIALLKDAIELSRSNLGDDSLAVGIEYYLLGFTAWQSGDMEDAGAWMARGITRMRVDMGWGHVVYLNAMTEYARFLRKRGQVEEADAAEREVRMAQNTVDVRTLNAGSLTVPFAGLR
jgi:tetratricopeptide (TPR) repeat protein